MPATFHIRPARAGDIDALVGLLAILFQLEKDFTVDANKQRQGLSLLLGSNQAVVLVAERGQRVVGMCSGQLLVSTAEGKHALLVEDLVILPEQRKQGLASLLLEELSLWAEQHKACRLQLLADKNNQPALHFYRANNWQSTALICLRKRACE